MKKTIVALLVVFTLLVPRLHAGINKQATADVNAVAAVVAEGERDNVVWFLIDSDSEKAAQMRIPMMVAKNEINRIPNKGEAHEALVRLLGRLMAREKAALDSRRFAYARLKAFSQKDPAAKKVLEEATEAVMARDADPLAPKLK
ncbi:MAG: hypothetical protein Q7R22_009220 [Verrucomicrobiota bacterium JB025]|nr:hypothetical protein [Verrucomicrobiota bacterium JB025]